jgi:hypothetical protein
VAKARRRDVAAAQGVALRSVEASGHYEQVGREFVGDRDEDAGKGCDVIRVAGAGAVPGYIQGEPLAGAGAGVGGGACAREEVAGVVPGKMSERRGVPLTRRVALSPAGRAGDAGSRPGGGSYARKELRERIVSSGAAVLPLVRPVE